jgi:hypothetical protein|uniref:Uncharacterized protein n=1 Tax=viral metagenome TaxID=1070528 RepID=A0A6C0CIV3_9ZZZZ
MFQNIKSLIYPLLISNPSFTSFYNDNRLDKSFIVSYDNGFYKASGTYNYLSRYSDKVSIQNSCNKDSIQTYLKLYHNDDRYYEKIIYDMIYLKNDDKPYHCELQYLLYKNDLPIKLCDIDEYLLKEFKILN